MIKKRPDSDSCLRAYPAISEIYGDLKRESMLTLSGVTTPEQAAWITAGLHCKEPERTLLLVAPTPQIAKRLTRAVSVCGGLPPDYEHADDTLKKRKDITSYTPALLPPETVSPYRGGKLVRDRHATARRMALLFAMTQPIRPRIMVTTAAMLTGRYTPKDVLHKNTRYLLAGVEEDRDELLESLVTMGYRRGALVEEPGECAVRGGIIDIWSPMHTLPVRIETLGDEIISLRLFNPKRQTSVRELEECYIPPVVPVMLDDDTRQRALSGIDRVQRELNIVDRRMSTVSEEISQGIYSDDLVPLLPLCYSRTSTLFDFLPTTTSVLLYNPYDCLREWRETRDDYERSYTKLISQDTFALPPEMYGGDAAWVTGRISKLARMAITDVVESTDDIIDPTLDVLLPVPVINADMDPHVGLLQESTGGSHDERFKPLVNAIGDWLDENYRIALCLEGEKQVKRAAELLTSLGLTVDDATGKDSLPQLLTRFAPSQDSGSLVILKGDIEAGFISGGDMVAVLSEQEVFGVQRRRRLKDAMPENAGAAIQNFDELTEGDYIVHVDYGIGVYRGLTTMEVAHIQGDFLKIDYLGGDKLYIPATRLEKVHRYSGNEGAAPRLDRMGGSTWEKTKGRIKRALRELAQELVHLYAERRVRKGFAALPPGDDFRQFEARFPFVETPHQELAITETVQDMQSSRIMDRLICGDVGFGKTEIAMRAAYMAVLSGKQVAVLVPTTVLAFQHLQTFRERFIAEPVTIDILSRFRSPAEQKQVMKDLAAGKVDIIIGTHRLLSKDIAYNDLGLLIVDEEHRFGVRHKEKIRHIKTDVDCLTMTATPIPRTLNHAFVGLKDLSLIETAPQDRHAIKTQIVSFDEGVIISAIRRELERGGQVYFLHNRVKSIHSIATLIRRLVPESKVAVAHGQMDAKTLEQIFLDFVNRSTNVLVTTTIIESGIDIPRVNTIFIHRADHFGLAQLYQLRGRVGRSTEQATCYLIVPSLSGLNKIARARLSTLMRFTELGVGFKIARHDMELRGTGALLGEKQSGRIDSVGLDLYLSLLDEAIAEAKGEPVQRTIEPDIKLSVSAYIPETYIDDISQRLTFYKRLNATNTLESVDLLADELADRFGEIPDEVLALLQVMKLKTILRSIAAETVENAAGGVKITINPNTTLDVATLAMDAAKGIIPVRLQPDSSMILMPPPGDSQLAFLRGLTHTVELLREYLPTETNTPGQQD